MTSWPCPRSDVTVDQPILVDRLRGCSIDAQGKAALTRFTYLAHDAHTTLLRCTSPPYERQQQQSIMMARESSTSHCAQVSR